MRFSFKLLSVLVVTALLAVVMLVVGASPAGAQGPYPIRIDKWEDLNGNGAIDPGEPRLAGFEFVLYNAGTGAQIGPSVFSNGTGPVPLGNVPNGTYSVCERVPAGWVLSYVSGTGATVPLPVSGATTVCSTVTIAGSRQLIEFANYEKASFRIVKQAIPTDAGKNFSFTQSGGGSDAWTLPGSNDAAAQKDFVGAPLFVDYVYTEGNPGANWALTDITCTSAAGGGDFTANVDLPGRSVTVQATGSGAEITCTFTNTRLIDIRVGKWEDMDGDGDPPPTDGDPRLGGYEFRLFDDTWTQIGASVFSSGASNVTLGSSLLAGEIYHVCEIPQTGWVLSYVSEGTPSDPLPYFGTDPVCTTITPTSNTVVHFANYKLPDFHIVKRAIPTDATALFDFQNVAGGTTFQLPGSNDAAAQADFPRGLLNNMYTYIENPNPDWALTDIDCVVNSGAATIGEDEAAGRVDITATQSRTDVTCTFTNRRLVDFDVYKYRDMNGDGDNDGGLDPLFDGWEMTIFRYVPPGWLILNTHPPALTGSAGTGKVEFDNLRPGTYRVCETPQTNWNNSDPGVAGIPFQSKICEEITVGWGDTPEVWFGNWQSTLTIVKDAVALPNDPQDFDFTGTWNFTLDDDPTSPTPNSKTWIVTPGTYIVEELNAFKNPWYLDKIDCVGTSNWSVQGGDLATITVPMGMDVVCTFTNIKKGVLIVEKQTEPDADPTTFTFTGDVAGTIGDGGQLVKKNVKFGTYSSTEAVPLGWVLGSIGTSCTEDGLADSTIDLGTATATFNLQPGETIKCVFTDYKLGHIIVDKVTAPGANDVDVFKFGTYPTAGYLPFTLTDVQAPDDQELVPSPLVPLYAVTEDVGALDPSWKFIKLECVSANGTSTILHPAPEQANIILGAGDTVRCTFVNHKRGKIIVDKVTNPGANNVDVFPFTTTGTGYSGFSLKDTDPANEQFWLDPGAYTVTEADPLADPPATPGSFDLSSLDCTDATGGTTTNLGTRTASIQLDPGDVVSCTFGNTKRGIIRITKETIPDADPQLFDFTVTGGPDNVNIALDDIGDGQTRGTGNSPRRLKPGTYVVTETVPTGWDLTAATCDDGSTLDAVVVDPGEIVTCTVTDTKRGKIKIVKVTNPAGDPTPFPFTVTGGPSALNVAFNLKGGQSRVIKNVLPGSGYQAAEDLSGLPDWFKKSAKCNGGSKPGNITVNPGKTTTCTFTNEKYAYLTVTKTATPGYPDTFGINVTGAPPTVAPFSLGPGNWSKTLKVKAGMYTVTETLPSAWWIQTVNTCADTAFPLDAGDLKTCAFENVRAAKLVVIKYTIPASGDGPFDFTVAGPTPSAFSLMDTQMQYLYILPGLTTITEADPGPNYYIALGGINCNLRPVSIDIPGRSVTIDTASNDEWICRFYNTKR